MGGDKQVSQGDSNFESDLRNLGLGEIPVRHKLREKRTPVPEFTASPRRVHTPEEEAGLRIARKNLRVTGVAGRVYRNLAEEKIKEVELEISKEETTANVRAKAKIKILQQRWILAGTALAVAFTSLWGVKSASERKVADEDKSKSTNEFVAKPNEVNQNIKDNLVNGNNMEDSDSVIMESDESGVNQSLRDNQEAGTENLGRENYEDN
jgi:hypothetical protein